MKDDLGRQMKERYEDALRLTVPARTHCVIRIDGRAFHTFTKELARPWSQPLSTALDAAAMHLCSEMMGCRFAYGQSDEYSFLLTDYDRPQTRPWFEGNVQKMVSVAASLFTAAFARAWSGDAMAAFDARLLVIPQREEVQRYFLWRQLDAEANSLNMLASAHYNHKQLLGKSTQEKHDLLHAKGINWARQPTAFKRGRIVRPAEKGWLVDEDIPVFTRRREYLEELIPQ
jgi:tRNA(His) guanylyltransferase